VLPGSTPVKESEKYPAGSATRGIRSFVRAVDIPVEGLDVEEGRSVQGIEAANGEPVPLEGHQVDETEGDGVRPFGRTGGKDPVLPIVVGRCCGEDIPAGTVAPVEDEEPGMEGEISQAPGKPRIDVDLTRRR